MDQILLNYVIRKLDCVNPVRLGKSMLLGASLPIASYYLLFLGIFALFLLGGVNTWPIVVRFAQDSTLVLGPIWAALLGSWMLYAYMYAAILLIPLALALTFALIHKPEIVVQLWDDATGALLILRDRIVAEWAHLTEFSPYLWNSRHTYQLPSNISSDRTPRSSCRRLESRHTSDARVNQSREAPHLRSVG